jgi:hypothetical protein
MRSVERPGIAVAVVVRFSAQGNRKYIKRANWGKSFFRHREIENIQRKRELGGISKYIMQDRLVILGPC